MTRTLANPAHNRSAFSLIELVIVVVIIGIIAAIAVPRLSNASGNSMDAAVTADITILNKAAEMYSAEHAGLTIAREPDGSATTDPTLVAKRLTSRTTDTGAFAANAIFGPYLRAIPLNPYTGQSTMRLGSLNSLTATPGGWIFDDSSNAFTSDFQAVQSTPAVVHGHGGNQSGDSGGSNDGAVVTP